MQRIGKTRIWQKGLGLLAMLRAIVFETFAVRAHGRIGVDAPRNRARP